MKYFLTTLLVLAHSIPSHSSSLLLGQEGNGGDGYAALFVTVAHELHRALMMEKYTNKQQVRDIVPMERFLKAIADTKVISVSDSVIDNHGNKVTAEYLTPEHITMEWKAKNYSEETIFELVETMKNEYPLGLIRFNKSDFMSELESSWGVAFYTVFHEYMRAMGIDENNYRTLSEKIGFSPNYFGLVFEKAPDEFKKRLNDVRQSPNSPSTSVSDSERLYNAEIIRLENQLRKDNENLDFLLDEFEATREDLRKSYDQLRNAKNSWWDQFISSNNSIKDATSKHLSKRTSDEVTIEQIHFLTNQLENTLVHIKKLRSEYTLFRAEKLRRAMEKEK